MSTISLVNIYTLEVVFYQCKSNIKYWLFIPPPTHLYVSIAMSSETE